MKEIQKHNSFFYQSHPSSDQNHIHFLSNSILSLKHHDHHHHKTSTGSSRQL
ncbi:hypothetical protein HanRHA438_Chr14g0656041 [Helianthus annuus]|nr:hypothetical protein HanRHA438_Chr14g0656041 [Helianthus annuus]